MQNHSVGVRGAKLKSFQILEYIWTVIDVLIIISIIFAKKFFLLGLDKKDQKLSNKKKKDSKILVHALVISRIDYCNSLFTGLPKNSIDKLQHIMNAAARVITKTPRSEHITPSLIYLHWLPVKQRCEFKTLTMWYNSLHNQAPEFLTDVIHPFISSLSFRSSE